MTDAWTTALDGDGRLSVVIVDCTSAAMELARAHLSGPTASTFLAQALAGVSMLGAEMSQAEETVTFRLDCAGPLEGFLVECTEKGTLRGYTRRKVLDAFDGGRFKETDVIGGTGRVEVIRSVPGATLASGAADVSFAQGGASAVAQALDAYFAQSAQRRVRTEVFGAAGDDGVPTAARGVMVECPPDGDAAAFARVADLFDGGQMRKALGETTFSVRTLLRKMGLDHAKMRGGESPLSFACRCSRERAQAMLDALPPADRAALPPEVDITCHMCGRIWTVRR